MGVTAGLFTVNLDFGTVFTSGDATWLETAVRCPTGSGGYTTLAPRQALTAVPYALYAKNIPLGGTGTSASAARSDHTHYARTVVVSPVGTDAQNGTALLNVLNDITTASSTNPWLLKIEPGIYNVGISSLTMKQYVDIEGSGEGVTKITRAGGSSMSAAATVRGANNAELRFLTVENTGVASFATGIYNDATSPRLTFVTVNASGGSTTTYGVVFNGSSTAGRMTNVTVSTSVTSGTAYGIFADLVASMVEMEHMRVSATGGTFAYGILSNSSVMSDVAVTASGGFMNNYGIFSSSGTTTMTNVTATASGTGASGNYAVYNNAGSSTMNNVTATATGGGMSSGVLNWSSTVAMMRVSAISSGGTNAFGVFNNLSAVTMDSVTASASGAGATSSLTGSTGVYNNGSTVTMSNGTIVATSPSDSAWGVRNYYSWPKMANLTVTATAGAGGYASGVHNEAWSYPIITNVTIAASGGGSGNYGMYNSSSSTTLANVDVEASGPSSRAVYNTGTAGGGTVTIDRSTLVGGTNSIFNDSGYAVKVGDSKLGGAVTAGGGWFACVGSYNTSYAPLNSSCN